MNDHNKNIFTRVYVGDIFWYKLFSMFYKLVKERSQQGLDQYNAF